MGGLGYGRAVEGISRYLLAPLLGAVTVGYFGAAHGDALEATALAFFAFFQSAFIIRYEARWVALLPFMAVASVAVAPVAGALMLALLQITTGLPGVPWAGLLLALVLSSFAAAVPRAVLGRASRHEFVVRIAVIGSARSAQGLAEELELAREAEYAVVGRIAMSDEDASEAGDARVPVIGLLGDLGEVVASRDIDLLVMTQEVPRLMVFDEISRSCLHLPVRLSELSGFYEDVFGHVPVAEINTSWFQYIMHPNYRSTASAAKRPLELVIAVVVGLLSLPVLLLAALLIRRDGGPVLFRQTRIGEGGRPFTVYKLRTMRVGAANAAQWASPEDPRVTGVGRRLRKMHLDEFPQIINVLKGEMSLVGPRPEQPEFVAQLEHWIPFYSRRHLLKPGITGWAQIRCGYAGSDVGSAWKLCHDLHYLKHRSLHLDIVILGETLRTLFSDSVPAVEPTSVSSLLDAQRGGLSRSGAATLG